MPRLKIERYSDQHRQQWDDFISRAKNGSFLFLRDFMDYHRDRFDDFSLLVFRHNKLIAVLPANIRDTTVCSHQGLTYGGLVVTPKLKFDRLLEGLKTVLQFLVQKSIRSLIFKPIPKIYHRSPADEIDYLLFLLRARPVKRELASTIYLPDRPKIQNNRLEGVKKAKKHNLILKKETDFKPFWETVLVPNLKRNYHTAPVHSAKEIELLAHRFPRHIHQFNVYKKNSLVGGTTIFETDRVAHTQYISADEHKQKLGTLDFLFDHLINHVYPEKPYFDFGTSNTPDGQQLNGGLLYWKECFGGRGIAYDTYEIDPANHTLLNAVFT